jgi:dTDP-glucose 4,6-dehydratase
VSKYVAVTGCAGFIGRIVTRKLLERGDYVYGIDALTYAADPEAVHALQREWGRSFSFVGRDILDLGRFPDVEGVIHLAAETHVDNSLREADRFVRTNVNGTLHLLEMTRAKSQHGMPHFIHISTDEVYGSIEEGKVTEGAPLRPTSPYAASKAAADLLVQAWSKTYGVPSAIIRPTNAYGPGQYPEKLIPKAVRSLMLGRPIPIHGDGSQTRCWLNVEDLADAILLVLDQRLGGIYNVGGNAEASVWQVATRIGNEYVGDYEADRWTELGFHRPACDLRYAVDDSRIRMAGWEPKGNFWRDLPDLVEQEKGRFRF